MISVVEKYLNFKEMYVICHPNEKCLLNSVQVSTETCEHALRSSAEREGGAIKKMKPCDAPELRWDHFGCFIGL